MRIEIRALLLKKVPKYLPLFDPTKVIDHGVTYFVKIPSAGN
jgi:hypothetical protein